MDVGTCVSQIQFARQYIRMFWWDSKTSIRAQPQTHKYTNTQIHKHTQCHRWSIHSKTWTRTVFMFWNVIRTWKPMVSSFYTCTYPHNKTWNRKGCMFWTSLRKWKSPGVMFCNAIRKWQPIASMGMRPNNHNTHIPIRTLYVQLRMSIHRGKRHGARLCWH